MGTYCFNLSVDGEVQRLEPAECADRDEAIAHGRALLKAALVVGEPQCAYVSVFTDEGADDEPLGAWDWSQERRHYVWTGAKTD